MIEGYITKGIGGFYYVKTEQGVLESKPRGIFRKRKITPLAGDNVVLVQEGNAYVIDQILPRKSVLIRPPCANLDMLFLVASTTQPVPSTMVLDTMAAIAVEQRIKPVIVCTKKDIETDAELSAIYKQSPIPFISVDYETGAGLDEIKTIINGNFCAFCGNSGVGKSTLLNALVPGLKRDTAAISQKLGRGKHTTREVEVFEACGGRIADTPGFASLDTLKALHIPADHLQYDFEEFLPYIEQCRFSGCSHCGEKGCAVTDALQAGKIMPSRYESYRNLYKESKSVPEWQLK